MSLLGPFDRPLALRIRATRRQYAPLWTVAPPAPVPSDLLSFTDRPNPDRAQFLTRVLLGPTASVFAAVPEIESAVDERVVAWSPSMYTTSRTELVHALLDGDDSVDCLDVSILSICAAGRNVYVQWRVRGRFDNAAFLDDDFLIEPSHGIIQSAGVVIYSFAGTVVDRIECYYDALTLLEQILPPSDTVEG